MISLASQTECHSGIVRAGHSPQTQMGRSPIDEHGVLTFERVFWFIVLELKEILFPIYENFQI